MTQDFAVDNSSQDDAFMCSLVISNFQEKLYRLSQKHFSYSELINVREAIDSVVLNPVHRDQDKVL